MKAVVSEWFKHLPENERQDFEKTLRNSTFILSRLRDILKDRVKDTESLQDYESPSWAYRQAHINGRKEENRQILKLLEFLE